MADKSQGITKITVQGFKSLYDETSVEIRSLTLLAGANSSGKSSIMQPLLLMKQTLEAEYEPKVFRLDGANVKFTSTNQFFSKAYERKPLSVAIELDKFEQLDTQYIRINEDEVVISLTKYTPPIENSRTPFAKEIRLRAGMQHNEISSQVPVEMENLRQAIENLAIKGEIYWNASQNRCFLDISMVFADGEPAMQGDPLPLSFFPLYLFSHIVQEIIHVPGLRSNPKRSYPVTAVNARRFEGSFENYVASIIQNWLETEDDNVIHLGNYMQQLGLAWALGIEEINEAEVQITVGRKPIVIQTDEYDDNDLVSIADVGFGVSQVLPVLVALLVAKPGQLVYLEQPELHLHPRAQTKLAEIIADAAKRGVRVVVETHSSLLLLGVQTLIAENQLNHEDVILHWFKRGEDGKTTVTSVEPDENGAYGEWPEDFADVELDAQSRYMEAVEKRLLEQQN